MSYIDYAIKGWGEEKNLYLVGHNFSPMNWKQCLITNHHCLPFRVPLFVSCVIFPLLREPFELEPHDIGLGT